VHGHFAKRPLRRRIIALAAAYALALSGLLASFGGAYAEATANPTGVLCHNAAAGEPAPLTGQSNSKICIERCCIGCLTPLAALPAPAGAVPLVQAPSYRIAVPAAPAIAGVRIAKSHRSRAPPVNA
jgi:hypothetical protein